MDAQTHRHQVQKEFLRTSGVLRGYLVTLVGDLSSADDLLQETFLVVDAKAAEFTLGTDFLAWARRIAHYQALHHLRSRRRGAALSPEAIEALATDAVAVDEKGGAWEARRRALLHCLARMRGRARELIDLRYRGELAPPQIADRLRWGLPAVNTALSRARRALRQCADRRLADGGHG